ncbi:hypothetical protein [Pseudonocardia alni]|uniref:hypothetical protein n=1 Tax=Pseudonocardia alni TaxID=33907 RepID=UPI00332C9D2D
MARRFYTHIDLTGFALIGALMNPVSADPSGLASSDAGRVWYRSDVNQLRFWNGTTAINVLDRAAQTGTQLASTISDLAATVKAYKLNEFGTPVADVAWGGYKITGLGAPTSAGDAVTKSYVDAIQDALTNGVVLKGAARVATATNTSISAPGSTIDGVTMATDNVVLLYGQSTGSQNGPWLWKGASTAMVRPANWANGTTATPGAFWAVTEGTNADLFALMTTDGAVTIGTTATAFIIRGNPSTSLGNGYGTTVGSGRVDVNAGTGIVVPSTAGSAIAIDTAIVNQKRISVVPTATSGSWAVSGSTATYTHGLGTLAIDVVVRAGTSPYSGLVQGAQVEIDAVASDVNNVVLTLPAAPAANNWVIQVSA